MSHWNNKNYIMIGFNVEQPSAKFLIILSLLSALISCLLFISFSNHNNGPEINLIGWIFLIITVCLLITGAFPIYGWWGVRIVGFILFLFYFVYFLDMNFFTTFDKSLEFDLAQPSPLSSLIALIIYGIPTLNYTLWGSVKGKFGLRLHHYEKIDYSILFVTNIIYILTLIFLSLTNLWSLFKFIS